MKTLKLIALVAGMFAWQVVHADEVGYEDFLTDDLLKAFEQPRLHDGYEMDSPSSSIIRLTIVRSFDPPIMICWEPTSHDADKAEKAFLKVLKLNGRLSARLGAQGLEVDVGKNVALGAGQEYNLRVLLAHAKLASLPPKDWRSQNIVDGSRWIYEVLTAKSHDVFVRSNPFTLPSDNMPEALNVDQDRLAKEGFLTGFGLMLWAYAGLNDELY